MFVFQMDLDFDRKLIDLIKANPMLYEKDLRSTPYTDMKKKFELWSHIATSLNSDSKFSPYQFGPYQCLLTTCLSFQRNIVYYDGKAYGQNTVERRVNLAKNLHGNCSNK